MKKLLCAAAIVALAAPAMAADVGVSVAISQPGVYGRIDIGNFPQPAVISAQPVIIQQPRVVVAQPVQPVYLWVPPGHQKHWDKHCREYNACGVPVYFVKDEWYQQNVMHGKDGDRGEHGKGKGHGKGKHGD
jgi:hypothetical protein